MPNQIKEVLERAAELDRRRKRQLVNQVDVINRLLKGATYDDILRSYVARISAVEAALEEALIDVAAHQEQESDAAEYRTAKGSWRDVSDLLEKIKEATS